LLKVDKVTAGYGVIPVIREIQIEIGNEETVALVGGNGAGKSTLLKVISGLIKPRGGQVFFEDIDLTALPPHRIVDLGVIQVPEGRRIFPRMNVRENLLLGGRNIRARQNVESLMEKVHTLFPILKSKEKQEAGTLSGGEQQMLAIGRGLMAMPKLILLDEPSLGLSPLLVRAIFETLVRLKEQGLTILLVEQNVTLSLKVADKGYVIENGKIALSGSGKSLLENGQIKAAYWGI
jgi:branched-chain amino acid transport system ATP-binding protein